MDLSKENVFVINGSGATAADGFCPLEIIGEEEGARELHQDKHQQNIFSLDDYMREYNKSAMKKDIFIVFTTGNTTITAKDLPARGGIVSRENFKDYFGPFAARAFFNIKIDINQATRSQLETIAGIGEKTANQIIEERLKRKFDSCEDFEKRGFKWSRTSSRVFFPEAPISDSK